MVKEASEFKAEGPMVKVSSFKIEGQSQASMVECSDQSQISQFFPGFLFRFESSIGLVYSAVLNNGSRVDIERIPVISFQTAMESLQEVTIMKYLKNKGVSNLSDIIIPKKDDFKEIFLVFPATTTSLREIIDSRAILTTDNIKVLFSQLILCLDVIHHAGIIHRDLKPENLMVGKTFSLAIFDFGTSIIMGRNSNTLQAKDDDDLQVLRYRAPELIRGSKEVCTASVDVWSAGCLLAELLIEGPLFLGKSLEDLIDGIPQTVQNLGHMFTTDLTQKSAVNLLSRMLQLDPSERITIHEILDHPFIHDTTTEFRESFVRGKRLIVEWEPEQCQDEAALKLLLLKEINEFQNSHQVAEEEQQFKGGQNYNYFDYFAEQEDSPPYHKSDQTSCIQAEDDGGIIEKEEEYCTDAGEDNCHICGGNYADGARLKEHLRRNPDHHKMKVNKGRWKKGANKN